MYTCPCASLQELNNATFRPDLKTPCVCGKGKGLRDSSALETAKHTVFCQNFMRACESLNKNSEVQNMSDKMRRHVSHFAAYVRPRVCLVTRVLALGGLSVLLLLCTACVC